MGSECGSQVRMEQIQEMGEDCRALHGFVQQYIRAASSKGGMPNLGEEGASKRKQRGY